MCIVEVVQYAGDEVTVSGCNHAFANCSYRCIVSANFAKVM